MSYPKGRVEQDKPFLARACKPFLVSLDKLEE